MAYLLIAFGISFFLLSAFGSPWLLKLYVREVRSMKIPEVPGESTICYPLA